jgi:hypothetical protein
MTVCTNSLRLAKPYSRLVDVAFDAPHTSSDGGLLLLRGLDERLGVCAAVGALVPDTRDARKVTHDRTEQVRQRVLQIAMGYEDCNDAEHMRHDPMLKLACLGEVNPGDALSSQPSLSRFENAVQARDIAKMLAWTEQSWVDSLAADTELVILDVDSTDDPTHGHQQLAMFHGFYDQHMYHPLLIIDGLTGQLITAVLRSGHAHAATGAIGRIRRLIQLVKARFPQARVAVRGDSAFAMPHITAELDRLQLVHAGVDFVFGMARNKVLERLLAPEMAKAKQLCQETGLHVRRFCEFDYAAGTWPYQRRIIGKAEYGQKGANPRFLVTSLADETPEELYDWYCQRGQAENDIKNFKRGLKGDRLSCHTFFANFFRLMLHVAAYRLMFELREMAKPHSEELGKAEFTTLRLRILKVAALVAQSVRRVVVRLPASFGFAEVFRKLLLASGPPQVA